MSAPIRDFAKRIGGQIMNKKVLSIRGLTVRYGNGCAHCKSSGTLTKNRCPICGTVWALRHADVDLYQGEILGIVGESGSGKSTLMRSLYFDFDITSGACTIENYKDGKQNIFKESMQQKRYIKNNLMGMVYQNPVLGLRMNYSAAGNIAEKLIAAGRREFHPMTDRVKELLNSVDILEERMKEPPKNFSGGMQQRVQISKALANNPEILLLDEVTTGLDLSVQAKVLDLIRRIRRDFGVSILLVSHDLAVIRMIAFCDFFLCRCIMGTLSKTT